MNTKSSTHLSFDSPPSPNGDPHSVPIALTIAGSDPTSGAGIQADLKTFAAQNVYGLSVITATTAQNTMGVQAVYPVSHEVIERQCQTLITDIPIRFIKTGMIYDSDSIRFIANFIVENNLVAVVDTPFMSSGGKALMEKAGMTAYLDVLIPRAEIITPNIMEAEMLSGCKITSKDDVEQAAEVLISRGAKSVLIKGGHLDSSESPDYYKSKTESFWFDGLRIPMTHAHGTGCTLSAAICANLALGNEMPESIRNSKEYITNALQDSFSIGEGRRILAHLPQYSLKEII
ncbi:MAG: bifunctional hydroxymethylpyrimidine kinase/phosphomethylpyrimidine kinase [Bacteroidota bacterium]|nr:bifunctional hydroxymethylpyrimidine kinase/phosphomethylpyrimidine kinase [Bacteroidota bacterium]MDP4229289.1 bifunctional hydroxymethylpyrimidine kinase/phosphomethylpyrimidine kinase [Bacteroidota bacterium]MDP4234886.1 bifunctional hydroxymethylpyrimidine kinase/phosphomethylpyrimidine kinase [Bacteroidota bacterium]